MDIHTLVTAQKAYFATRETHAYKARKEALVALKKNIKLMEQEILASLKLDLGKDHTEGYMTEVYLVFEEINYQLKHLKRHMKDVKVKSSLANFPSSNFRRPVPYGTVLIMSPWNYPFLLTLSPLVDALAAGNTAILKPGSYSPATSKVIQKLISLTFKEDYVAVVLGGRSENEALLEEAFDYIFFTGSTEVGKIVMAKASAHLTPVTLELGGKSPCIVDKTADLALSAKRIIFGKMVNVGQTCIAPDYLIVEESVKEELVRLLKLEISKQYGEDYLHSESYGKIINEKHFLRLTSLIKSGKVVSGGKSDPKTQKIELTIFDEVSLESLLMNEELFGPLLPILTYKTFSDIETIINHSPTPLALYVFSKDKKLQNDLVTYIPFGGGAINDTIMHIASNSMPFGGVGKSGMGSYHGKVGFDTFSHKKSILKKGFRIDVPLRYRPFGKRKVKIINKLLK